MKYKYLLIFVNIFFVQHINTMGEDFLDKARATATLEYGMSTIEEEQYDGGIGFTHSMRNLENGDVSFDIPLVQDENKYQLPEIFAPKHVHQQLIGQGLCFKGEDGRLYPNMKRFDFEQFVRIVQSVANIVAEVSTIKETLNGSSTAFAEERNARTIAQRANERNFEKTKLAGVGAFVVAITPSIVAIIKAFTN